MLKNSGNPYKQFSPNAEDATAVLNWVNNLSISQIKPLSLQMALKFIGSIYQDRKKNTNNASTPLHIYCYDFFISNYGLKKLAEDKLKKVIIFSHCLK